MVRHALAPALPLAVVLWTCAIAAAGPSPILAQSSADSGRVYRVAPGDRLTITVIGNISGSKDTFDRGLLRSIGQMNMTGWIKFNGIIKKPGIRDVTYS